MLLVTVLTMLADLIGQNVVRKLSLRTRGGPWKGALFRCEEYHFEMISLWSKLKSFWDRKSVSINQCKESCLTDREK